MRARVRERSRAGANDEEASRSANPSTRSSHRARSTPARRLDRAADTTASEAPGTKNHQAGRGLASQMFRAPRHRSRVPQRRGRQRQLASSLACSSSSPYQGHLQTWARGYVSARSDSSRPCCFVSGNSVASTTELWHAQAIGAAARRCVVPPGIESSTSTNPLESAGYAQLNGF